MRNWPRVPRPTFLVLLAALALSTPAAFGESEPPLKLSAPLVAGGNVLEFKVSANGGSVVYRADQETDEKFELYSVPAAGGTAVKLNHALIASHDVVDFRISPDGAWVVYRAMESQANLYSVPIGGGTAVRLNDAAPVQIVPYLISPDSTRVVFIAGTSNWVVPIAGGTPLFLASSSTWPLELVTPDSSTLVFRNDTSLRSVALDGGPVNTIAPSQTSSTLVLVRDVLSDSSRLILDQRNIITGFKHQSMYSKPPQGGGTTIYDSVGNTCCPIGLVAVTAAPVAGVQRIVWTSYDTLESSALDGSSNVTIVGALGLASQPRPRLAGDATILYRAGSPPTGGPPTGLFAVPTLGGASNELSGPLPAGRAITSFRGTPDSTRAVYRADQTADDLFQLYAVPLAGGAPQQLSDAAGPGDVTDDWAVTPLGSALVYRHDRALDERIDLVAVSIDGGDPVTLSAIVVAEGDVASDWSITADSRWVVYRADQETDGVDELFRARVQTMCPSEQAFDADGDGVCAGDCAPLDAGAAYAASEVVGESFERAGDVERLSWLPAPEAESYAITRGSLSTLAPGQYGDCIVSGLVATTVDDATDPAEGEGFVYLIQGENACGLGPLGDGAGGPRVNEDAEACTP